MGNETLRKIGTLGGTLKISKENLWMYGQGNPNLTRERLHGIRGPLYIGMPKRKREEAALEATESDTKKGLIRELTEQTHMTREEAERTVNELLSKGILKEVNDPTLGKVLIVSKRGA